MHRLLSAKFEGSYLTIRIFFIKITFTAKTLFRWFKCLVQFIDLITPKDSKQVVFLSIPTFSGNAKEYYDYLLKEHKDKYSLHWLYTSPDWHDDFEHKKYAREKIGQENYSFYYSLRGMWRSIRAKYIISTHADSRAVVTFMRSKRRAILNLWHGMPFKTIGYHEPHIPKDILGAYKYLGERAHFFVTSDIFKHIICSSFKANPFNVHITGQPRTDCCFEKNPVIEEQFNFSKYSKIVLYLPTYKEAKRGKVRDINTKFENIFYLNDYDEANFLKFLEENNILFIVKPHISDENFYKKLTAKSEINSDFMKFIFNKDMLVNDIFLNNLFPYVDLMITDYSSAYVDFVITEKPVIFLNSLNGEYAKVRKMLLEDNFETLMVGDKVKTYDEFKEAIDKNLKSHSFTNEQKQMLKLIHKHFDNKASRRVYEIMQNIK